MRNIATAPAALALSAAAVLCPATASEPRPCELFSASDIASIAGSPPGPGQPDGPDTDRELAATAWTCGWQIGSQYFAASVIRFASAAAATRGMSAVALQSKFVPEGIKLSEQSGPGEQALWGASPEGAIWVARSGQSLLAIVYAGSARPPAALREPMRRALSAALAKMP